MSLTAEAPPPETDRRSRKRLRKDILRFVGVGAFFIAAAWLLKQDYVRRELFNIEQIRTRFQGMDWSTQLAFVGAAALVNALGVPRLWVSAVAGTLYGAVNGAAAAMGATLLGSTLNFYMGRTLLRGPLKRRMPQRLRRWYDLFNRHGFQAILYIRLFPFTNATVTNLMGGVSRVKFRVFLAATFVGYLPFTVVFATLGSSAAKQSGMQLGLGLGLFVVVLAGQWLWKKWSRGLEGKMDGADGGEGTD